MFIKFIFDRNRIIYILFILKTIYTLAGNYVDEFVQKYVQNDLKYELKTH